MSAFDRDAALGLLGNDATVLVELAEMFLSSYKQVLDSIRTAITEREARALHHAAHRLEGSLATFCAQPSITAAQALVQSGRNSDWTHVNEQFENLSRELDRLVAALNELVTKS